MRLLDLFVGALLLGLVAWAFFSSGSYEGTDNLARAHIQEQHPDYRPWFHSLWAPPSAEVEAGLFSLTAAGGGFVLGYCLGWRRRC